MSAQILTLTDPTSGSTAKVLVGLGFNCFQFQVPGPTGPLDVLWAEPGFEQGSKRASGSGIPILFPFPGRIAGTSLHWQGTSYPLEPGDGRGNAIHGFVHERPWRVVEQSPSRVVAQFHASVDDPALLQRWPADFRITATCEIGQRRLTSRFLLENPDQRPLPCGLGTHPYFALPLGGPSADACVVKLPVSSSWELVDMNATGQKLPLADAAALQQGRPFAALTLDNVFSDLMFQESTCQAAVEDPGTGTRVILSFDRTFRECVVYTPPHRQAICIEPYTCVPDPFRLEQIGVDAGLRVLAPGESFTASQEIRVE